MTVQHNFEFIHHSFSFFSLLYDNLWDSSNARQTINIDGLQEGMLNKEEGAEHLVNTENIAIPRNRTRGPSANAAHWRMLAIFFSVFAESFAPFAKFNIFLSADPYVQHYHDPFKSV